MMSLKKWVVLSAAGSALLLAGCQNAKADNTNAAGATWSRMEKDNITSMDPSKAVDGISAQAITDTMEGLYRYGGTDLQPGLAKSIVKPTHQGTVYTFKLRSAKWSNGDPVTAQDFVYGWRRTIDPKTKSQYTYLYTGIKNADAIMAGKKKPATLGVKALDQHTFQVTLDHPIPYFNTMLASFFFYPENANVIAKYGKQYGTKASTLVSDGTYILKNWNGSSTSWQEVKNPTYWNAKKVHIKQINVTAIKDASTAMNLFQSSKLDDAIISGDQAAQAKAMPDYKGLKQTATTYLQLNEKTEPAFKNTKIRQAISHALDRDEFIKKVLQNGSVAATGFTPIGLAKDPTTGKDFNQEAAATTKQYSTHDTALAKKLWTDGLAESGKKSITTTLLVGDGTSDKKTAEYIQNALETALPGMHVNVSAVPAKTKQDREFSGDFGMDLSGWIADFPDPITFLDCMTSDNTYNQGKWSNAQYDKLIKESKTTYATQPAKRWQVLLQAQKLLTQEQGMIPLYQTVEAHLVNKKISGMTYGPTNYYNFVGAKIK